MSTDIVKNDLSIGYDTDIEFEKPKRGRGRPRKIYTQRELEIKQEKARVYHLGYYYNILKPRRLKQKLEKEKTELEKFDNR